MNPMIVKEYAKSLSEKDLFVLNNRFSQKLPGDLAEFANVVAKDERIDRWLSSSRNAFEWFDMVDFLGRQIQYEFIKRTRYGEVVSLAS
jgi:hypothetical protein